MAEYINKESLLAYLYSKQEENIDVMKEIADFPAVLMDENMALAMCAGARAIKTNRRCNSSIYVLDVFGSGKEISYYEAAKILRENAEKVLVDEAEHG